MPARSKFLGVGAAGLVGGLNKVAGQSLVQGQQSFLKAPEVGGGLEGAVLVAGQILPEQGGEQGRSCTLASYPLHRELTKPWQQKKHILCFETISSTILLLL